ncbi:MAG: hypothetical protein D6B25_06395 [Desulfobulbaceae bacterium]|nr:MAG: hypothetical protein D6B25_06395 [Desulfobulbaceae bacterium]
MIRIPEWLTACFEHREIIVQLTKRDLVAQYKSSRLGMMWAVIEPFSFMLLIAIVLDVGLQAGSHLNVPFVAFLLSGMSVYLVAAGVLEKGARLIIQYAFLLNKVNFRVSLLPLVAILSNTINHFLTLLPVVIILLYFKIFPNWFWFQTLYYLVCLLILLLGCTWFVSALCVIAPDFVNVVGIFTRFLLYLSPVFWDISVFPEWSHLIIMSNPFYYIIAGYRDSLLFHVGFWHHPWLTLYFWLFTGAMLVVGALVFRKFKPVFSDYV